MASGGFSQLALQLLDTTAEHLETLDRGKERGLIEIAPVSLPEQPLGDNDHLGWPVATQAGDSLVLIRRRIPGHNPRGAGDGDVDSTFSMAMTSDDGGHSWSEAFDLRNAMEPSWHNRGGALPLSHRYKFGPVNDSRDGYKLHLNAIGTSAQGTVVALCNYGAFRSTDSGSTWTHLHGQFREDTTPGDIVYLGPRIVQHPEMGLCAFGNTVGYGGSDRFPNPVDGPVDLTHHSLVILHSQDEGLTWQKEIRELPRWAAQHEASAVCHEGDLFILGRDSLTNSTYLQIRVSDRTPIDVRRASVRHTRALDTPDIDFNPITGRLEFVRSFREKQLIDLWSIDPEDWESAEWRYEGVLFSGEQRGEEFYKSTDGFHPAGGVIDADSGVQHIFFYSGHPNGPAGTFRLTRTLNTPELSAFLEAEGG